MNLTKSERKGHGRILYLILAFLGYCGLLLWVFLAIGGLWGFQVYLDGISPQVTFAMRISGYDSRFPWFLGFGIFLTCTISLNLFFYARYRKERTLTENIVFFLPLHFAISGMLIGVLQLVFLAPFIMNGFPKSGTEEDILQRGWLWIFALFVTATVVASIGSVSRKSHLFSRFFLWGPSLLNYLPLHVAWSYVLNDGGDPDIPIFPTPKKVFISLLVVYAAFGLLRCLTKGGSGGDRRLLASRACFGALANAVCMFWAAGLVGPPYSSIVLPSRPEDRPVQELAEVLTILIFVAVNVFLIAAFVRKRGKYFRDQKMEN